MSRLARLLTAMLLATAVMAVPVTAEEPADPCEDETGEIVYTEEQVWFHEGETKVGNLTQHDDQPPAPWDTNGPAGSVQGGNGAGSVSALGSAEGIVAGTAQRAHFAGSFTGCIDTIAVDIFHFSPTNRSGTSGSLAEAPLNYSAELVIDGQTYLLEGPQEAVTTPNAGGSATYQSKFAISGVRDAMERTNTTLNAEHDMALTITAWYANTNNVVFVWDTTEVPSGMTFNGDVTGYGFPVRIY